MIMEIEVLCAGYGAARVLHSVDFDLHLGEIVAVVGANGAGKSTLFKAISGLVPAEAGRVRLFGRDLADYSPAERLDLGIAHVPERRQIFAAMSVEENLRLGAYRTAGPPLEAVLELFPALARRLAEPARALSGGEQQMLAIARGLMSGPRVLLLDEPSLGLAPDAVDDLFRMVGQLRAQRRIIVLAERSGTAALAVADRGFVLENGRITRGGPAHSLLRSPEIAARPSGAGLPRRADQAERGLAEAVRECLGTRSS